MTTEELIERQRIRKEWMSTELGSLFEKFVNLHARAWQLDERSSNGYLEKTAEKAWKELEPVETELRNKLMKISGIVK